MEILRIKKTFFKKNLNKIKSYNTAFYIKTLHHKSEPKYVDFPSIELEEGFEYHILEHVHHVQNAENKQVWMFEDDFEKLFSFLHLEVATSFLKTGKCFFVHRNPQLLKKVTWYLATKKYKIYGSVAFCQRLEQSIGELLSNLVDFKDFGSFIYNNLFKNVRQWDQIIPFSKLKNLGQKKPCIIVGAGPSLEKNIHVLKEYQKKAFILAGGSCIKPLLEHAIVPDFLIALDPHDAQIKRAEFFKDLKIPTFFNNRVHPEVFEKIQGPKIHLGSIFGFPVCHLFEEAFGLDSDNDFGWNVLCALTKIAHIMDFSPICFVGTDFSYETNKYAFDAFLDSREQFLEKEHAKTDIFGKEVITQIKWLQEKKWIESYIEKNSSHAINCTQGGLGFQSVENQTLQSVFEHLPNITKEICLPKPTKISKVKVQEMFLDLIKGLENHEEEIEKILIEPLFLAKAPLFYSFEELFTDAPSNLDFYKETYSDLAKQKLLNMLKENYELF